MVLPDWFEEYKPNPELLLMKAKVCMTGTFFVLDPKKDYQTKVVYGNDKLVITQMTLIQN